MPSPFYATDATYGLRALTGASTIADIDLGFSALRDDIAAKMKGAVPRVAALPTVGPSGSGPLVDGQEVYFVADAANGVVWHLRYNAASGSAYKWEYIGGPPLFAEVLGAVGGDQVTGNVYVAPATNAGPAVTLPTLPSGGDFDVQIGMTPSGLSVTGLDVYMSYDIGATGAVDADAARMAGGGTADQGSVYRPRRKTGLASATVLTAKYRVSTAGQSAFVGQRFMAVRPVRVG